jgi:hypothetical protein
LNTFSYVLRSTDVTVKDVNHIRCFAIDMALGLILLSIQPAGRLHNVIAILRKGDKSLPSNYWLISLISCVGKIMERVIYKYIFNHVGYLHCRRYLLRIICRGAAIFSGQIINIFWLIISGPDALLGFIILIIWMVGHFLVRIALSRDNFRHRPSHHWKEIEKSETLGKLFPEPPVVAFRRPKSITDILVRAAVSRPSSTVGQCKPCGDKRIISPFLQMMA